MLKSSIILLVIFTICVCDNPADPIMPNKFSQTFKETTDYPILGSHDTTGKLKNIYLINCNSYRNLLL